jgi:hypothetical protein
MKKKTPAEGGERKPEPWHAVGIAARASSCEAAVSCRGKRYLSRDAPRLPLPECDRPLTCSCTYRHYPDRRDKPRRSSESGIALRSAKPTVEKRISRGRRKTD